MPHRRQDMPHESSRDRPHDVEVSLPDGHGEADAAGTGEHAVMRSGFGRRESDRELGSVAETAEHIVSKLSSVQKILLLGISVGTTIAAVMFWLGWRNEGPGARIDQLAVIVRENAAAGARRDSAMQQQVGELRLTVRELGYTVCLGSSEGRAADGPARCAQRFLIIRGGDTR